MTITFYTFSKKRNSTAQPTGGTSYTGNLTQESGIVSPSVIMDFGNTAPAYNYAYITEFGRYYWITEITSIGGGLWRVSMTVDVLATYKSDIGAASKYVLRSASSFDGTIVDMKYPTKSGYTYATDDVTSGLAPGLDGGNYIVGVVSPGATSLGSLNVWNLDASEFKALRNLLSPTAYYQNITDVDLQNVAIDIVNPMQYISFVKYYPMQIVQGSVDTMQLGPLSMLAHKLANPVVSFSNLTLNLSSHPQSATRGTYLNCEPFTQRFITWLPVGMIHVPGLLAGLTSINVSYKLDVISGIGDFTITDPSDADRILYRTSFSVGADIPIAQITTGNPLKLVSGAFNLVGTAASAITGNIGGAVTSGVSAISDFISSMVPEVQAMKPGSGSLMEDGKIRLVECFANIMDDSNTEFGRPLCAVRQISGLSGYVLCADGEVPAAGATQSELAEIESYLTGGFYYE